MKVTEDTIEKIGELYKERLESELIAELSRRLQLDAVEAMSVYYGSELKRQGAFVCSLGFLRIEARPPLGFCLGTALELVPGRLVVKMGSAATQNGPKLELLRGWRQMGCGAGRAS